MKNNLSGSDGLGKNRLAVAIANIRKMMYYICIASSNR